VGSFAQLVKVPVPVFNEVVCLVGETEDAEHGRRDFVDPVAQEVMH
jgi:hypothetical protein